MDYKRKIEYAEKVVQLLRERKPTEDIKADLKSEGLYERDIISIFLSAKNIIGESYTHQIREYLLADKNIHDSQEFTSMDQEILDNLINDERQKLGLEERKKITRMMKEGQSGDDVLKKVDFRFLSPEKAMEHIVKLHQVKEHNSVSKRTINIAGGIGLIVLTGVILMASGRLFYVLPIIGLVMVIKGFTTEEMSKDD